MRATRSDRADEAAICRELEGKFQALALELGRAIDALPIEEMGGAIWARLQCAKATAEEGAAVVRNALPPAPLDQDRPTTTPPNS